MWALLSADLGVLLIGYHTIAYLSSYGYLIKTTNTTPAEHIWYLHAQLPRNGHAPRNTGSKDVLRHLVSFIVVRKAYHILVRSICLSYQQRRYAAMPSRLRGPRVLRQDQVATQASNLRGTWSVHAPSALASLSWFTKAYL